jgi:hypothetical protein
MPGSIPQAPISPSPLAPLAPTGYPVAAALSSPARREVSRILIGLSGAGQLMDRHADVVPEAIVDRVDRYVDTLTDLALAIGARGRRVPPG